MPLDYEVDVGKWKGLDIDKIVGEELFGASVRTQQKWQENLRQGVGAKGSHGGPYVDTGEAVNDVTVDPPEPGHSEYVVGGDVVQLAIAAFGRRPGRAPPFDAISAWARRVGLTPNEGQTWDSMVWAICQSIAERGLPAFAPETKAFNEVTLGLDGRIQERLEREYGESARQ